jgi:hypothetical protein
VRRGAVQCGAVRCGALQCRCFARVPRHAGGRRPVSKQALQLLECAHAGVPDCCCLEL